MGRNLTFSVAIARASRVAIVRIPSTLAETCSTLVRSSEAHWSCRHHCANPLCEVLRCAVLQAVAMACVRVAKCALEYHVGPLRRVRKIVRRLSRRAPAAVAW
jgi:hypothetical protein